MVGHLYQFGYSPIVITAKHQYREEIADEWMVELAGNHFEKIEIDAFPTQWARKLGIGDLGLKMVPFLFLKLLLIAMKQKPKFILYLVPPWYSLLVAPIVKFFTGIQYGIDFIDPWVEPNFTVDQNTPLKKRLHQFIARRLEGWVVQNASVIFSVSEGINDAIRERYPGLHGASLKAIPYGVELEDFNMKPARAKENKLRIRHIGVVSEDARPILGGLFDALSKVSKSIDFSMEFYGTTYAGSDLAKPQLNEWKEKFNLNGRLFEHPHRVTYKRAVELTLTADILLLFGGMQSYYAASKLMGLVASQRPFLAFLHRDSFPSKFLISVNYPYLVSYSSKENDLPIDHIDELIIQLNRLIRDRNIFQPIPFDHPAVLKHTAYEMTKNYVDEISKVLNPTRVFP